SSISASALDRSPLATATPSSARCQESLISGEPTSLTNTPRRSRTRSLIRRITIRLSLSEWASANAKLILAIPTYTAHPTLPGSDYPSLLSDCARFRGGPASRQARQGRSGIFPRRPRLDAGASSAQVAATTFEFMAPPSLGRTAPPGL